MASVLLAQAAKLTQNQLVSGVIENIYTTNQFYEIMPFAGIQGNALAYNRELALGDVQLAGVGTQITAKTAATFTQVSSSLTTIIGDAEVNGLLQSTYSDRTDQTAVQIASKAKSVGRTYQDYLITGDSNTTNEFDGLLNLAAAGQTVSATATDGDQLDFEKLDEIISLVKDKDGQVDYIMMNDRSHRKVYSLLRSLGGAGVNDVVTLPSGKTVLQYRNIPIFINDYIPITQTQGGSSDATTIIAGTVDDGSMTVGLSGLTSANDFGVQVVDVGEDPDYDNHIWRVKFYAGLALFNENGLAIATGIIP